jgi:hypothetical protein
MSEDNTKVIDLSTEQQKAIIDTKEVLASKQDVLREVGQIEAFEFINKLATVATLKLMAKAKERKEYVGLTYKLENGELATVANWGDFCSQILKIPKRTIDERLLDLNTFGEEFFEASQRIGLGTRELRKLRQLPTETQDLIINSEKVDLNDKEAVKELIEDAAFKYATEKAELTKQVKEANQTVDAVRANSAEKQQQLDQAKELEAKRQFSQAPWQRDALDNVNAMIEARAYITQGTNQLLAVLNNLSNNHELDSKAIDLIGRSLLTEAKHNFDMVNEMANEAFGILGSKYHPDLFADDLFTQLHSHDESEVIVNAE